jgi:hypothetical protein
MNAVVESKRNSRTVEPETAVERWLFSTDLLLYRSTALFFA